MPPAAALLCVAAAAAPPDPTLVDGLPGVVGHFRKGALFSGYLPVNGSRRHLFYILAAARTDPATAPLLFWTNGGPGCSSVGEGFWMEHGAYRVSNAHAGIEPNPFGWDGAANVLYVEHPVGVGFSYSDDPADYRTNDDFRAARDLYDALVAFAQRHPAFAPSAARPLYLSGESYGGEYVPHLAYEVVTGRSAEIAAHFRGFIVGNPVFFCDADRDGRSATAAYRMLLDHGLMSYDQFAEWGAAGCDRAGGAATCSDDYLYCMPPQCLRIFAAASDAVGTVNQQLLRQRRRYLQGKWRAAEDPVEADFDPDHKYQSFCLANATLAFTDEPNADTQASFCHPLGDPGRMADYLNREDVQHALHIDATKMANRTWQACADDWFGYKMSKVDVLKAYYQEIWKRTSPKQFRVLVFSGDEDLATVPTPVTQGCLAEVRGNVTRTGNWTPWHLNGITAGYTETFDRYTFATVKGAGHTVPQYQPKTTYELISRWLRGDWPPSSRA